MFATVLSQLTGLLDKRFQIYFFLPALVFTLGAISVAFGGGGGVEQAAAYWSRQDGVSQAGLVILTVAGAYIFGLLLSSRMVWLIRIYEGYLGPAYWWRAKSVDWHRTRMNTPSVARELEYPTEAGRDEERFGLLPTRLGNILRAGELYAFDRYGADAVIMWPRLVPLVPAAIGDRLDAARERLEVFVLLSALSSVFGVGAAGYLVCTDVDLAWPVGIFVGASMLAVVMYLGCLGPALNYANAIRVSFDLHRLSVFTALQVPLPADVEEERRRWSDLNRFLYRNDPTVWWPYSGPSKSSAEPSEAKKASA